MKKNTYETLDVKFHKGETMKQWLDSLKYKVTKKDGIIKSGWYTRGETGD